MSDPDLFPDEEPARPLEKRYDARPLTVQTLFGLVPLRRRYYHHVPSHTGRCPLDERLGLVESFSPAVARLMCEAAARSGSSAQAAEDLHRYAGVEIETRAFDRLVNRVAPELAEALQTLPPVAETKPIPVFYVSPDGTGLPMRGAELEGRAGRQPDGTAKTREAKLGAIFTQTVTDDEGEPVRDPDSTSYVGTLAGSAELGLRLHEEARRRGLDRAQQVVFLGDGSAWVWEIARLHFPEATQILDFYHAAEYVGELATLLHGDDEAARERQQTAWLQQMKATDPGAMLEEARRRLATGDFSAEQRWPTRPRPRTGSPPLPKCLADCPRADLSECDHPRGSRWSCPMKRLDAHAGNPNWRAGCGKSARPVRREGWRKPMRHPYPYP